MAIHAVYRFYAELEGYKPKIWRRFEMSGNKTVAELAYIVMVLFEMKARHLFRITDNRGAERLAEMQGNYSDEVLRKVLGKQEYDELMALTSISYELPYPDGLEDEETESYNARGYLLKNIAVNPPGKFIFEYDFGDGWCVGLTLETCEKVEIHASELPRALEGEGFGIIEDCGGLGGLKEIDKAFRKKKGRQYKEYKEWLGVGDLDISSFDIDDMNFRLKKLPRVYRDFYEYGRAPSQRSIDLIERKYRKVL